MNKHFIIYDNTGKILRTGNVPEEFLNAQVSEGEFLLQGEADCLKDAVDPITRTIIKDGNPNPTFNPVPDIPTPTGLSTTQQLDLLWQAMDSGTFPKAEPFYSAVKASRSP